MRFREQRGGLNESLTTVVNLNGRADLIAYLTRLLNPVPVSSEDVIVKAYGFDDRIGWDTYVVSVRNYGVVGFIDGAV